MQSYMRYLLGGLVLTGVGNAFAETFNVDAKVGEVILYTNQADITRIATVSINKAGQHELIVSNLLSSDVEDISVEVQGAQLLNQSIVVGEELTTSNKLAKWTEMGRQADIIQKKIEDNQALTSVLIKRLENADTDIDAVRERIATLRDEYEQLLVQQEKIDDEYNRLSKLLDWSIEDKEPQLQKMLKLTVNAEQAGDITLSLSERSDRAFWQPLSQWHLNSETKELDIIGQAKVSQMTGFAWDDVAITLAVMPMQYYYKPDFFEKTVSYSPDKISAKSASAADVSMASEETWEVQAAVEAHGIKGYKSDEQILTENGGNFQVTMPNHYSFASGRDSYLIDYYHEQTQADEVYSAFYSWDWAQEALLVAEWKQPGAMPLLAGQIKLYRDELFVTDLSGGNLLAPGTELSMSFGMDARMEVETITPPEYKENNGFISRDRVVKTEQTLSLTNHGDQSLPVRIYAQLPVTTEKSIEIKPTWSPKPDVTDADDVKGIVYWAKELGAEEKFSVEHGYEIRHPEDKRIVTTP